MAIDTPARLAILGAGPIGLETALYARFLGYDVDVFERGRIAQHVRQWGHVRMFSPFAQNCSPLGRAALAAQDESFVGPGDDELLTGNQWIDGYLAPLAASDLLSDHIHEHTTVVRVGRAGLLKGELASDEERGDYALRLLVVNSLGEERIVEADGVVDTTGVYGQPNPIGESGIPALGERAARQRTDNPLVAHIPDISGADRARYAAQHTVVIGGGHSAATTVCGLAQLSQEAPGTRVTWLCRQPPDGEQAAPVLRPLNDPLLERDRIAALANTLAGQGGAVTFWPGTAVQAIASDPPTDGWRLELLGIHAGQLLCDRLVANVGYRPDTRIFEELHVPVCVATERVERRLVAETLQSEERAAGIAARGRQTLAEPHFHVLGAKSYGRSPGFLFSEGLRQIRDLFAVLGDRPALDLYAGAVRLPR